MHRRCFLKASGALSGLAAFSQLGLLASRAAAATDDYKALVCVFLYGGNDGNNTIVPIDTAGYQAYSNIRKTLALPQASLLPLTRAGGSASYGLHPSLSDLQTLWNSGHLATLFNTGPLVKPLSKTDYLSTSAPKPGGLFSHSDQQQQWQSAISTAPSGSGWGGRLAEQVASYNSGVTVPASISTAGTQLFVTGASSAALAVPTSGTFGLKGFNNGPASNARKSALDRLLTIDEGNQLTGAAQSILSGGIDNSVVLNPLLTSNTTTSQEAFAGLKSGTASQLLAIAKLIEGRSAIGAQRQIFFASLGGFDTHSNQLTRQASLLSELGPALKAFHDAMSAIGDINRVTTFTLTDFARTLQPNTDGGTDHAWGNHHFIMGGAVKGRLHYGTFPTLALDGPSDAGNEGRWIPSTAVDQYAATLAQWFGVSGPSLASVLPNIGAFPNLDLQFMI